MKVKFSSKGDFSNAKRWLRSFKDNNFYDFLNSAGQMGVQLLTASTPKRSGETASGWQYRVEGKNDYTDLIFYNTAHPELEVNLAVLIQLGHGTGTGGYVPPVDYISQAMLPVYEYVGKEIERRLIK